LPTQVTNHWARLGSFCLLRKLKVVSSDFTKLKFNCRPRIDARTLRALYFAWDKSDEAEQNWTSIVEETHPDVKALKKKISKKNGGDTTSSPAERSPVTRLRQQVYTQL